MKSFKEFNLDERVLKNKWDKQYKQLLKSIHKLPWDEKSRKSKGSALNEHAGRINGRTAAFNWHNPDSNWGPEWNFLGFLYGPEKGMKSKWDMEEKFDKTGREILKNVGTNPSDKLQLDNIKELKAAIAFAQSMKFWKPYVDESIDEGKQDYQLYHDTYTSAVYAALAYATQNGYEHDPEEAAIEIGMGPRKPSKGKTNSITLPLYKKDKVQRKALHFQVYNRGVSRNTYELNAYIS